MEEHKNILNNDHSPVETHSVRTKPEIGFGMALNETWELFQRKFWNLFGTTLILGVISAITLAISGLVGLAIIILLSTLKLPMLTAVVFAIIAMAMAVFALWLNTWQMIAIIEHLSATENKTIKELLEKARPEAAKLLPLAIMSFLIILGGLLLFIVPGVILAIALAFIYIVAVLEKKGPWEAIQTSASLVKGRKLNVFMVFLGFGIISSMALIVTGWYFSPLWLILAPMGYTLVYVVYKHLQQGHEKEMDNQQSGTIYKVFAVIGAVAIFASVVLFAAAGGKLPAPLMNKFWMKNKYDYGKYMQSGRMMQPDQFMLNNMEPRQGWGWQQQWQIPQLQPNQPAVDQTNPLQYQIIIK